MIYRWMNGWIYGWLQILAITGMFLCFSLPGWISRTAGSILDESSLSEVGYEAASR